MAGARYAWRMLLLVPAFCAGNSDLLAQQIPRGVASLAGTVWDALTNQPLTNVSVLVQGTELRAFTDDSGRFSIDGAPAGPQLVRLSLFGYDEELVPTQVGEASVPLDVYLQPRPIVIEGVDVAGHSEVTLNGAVVDARSGEGLPWARLRLGNGRAQSADVRGSFRMEGTPPGSYLLYVERLGYESVYVPVTLFGSMEPIAVELEPDSIMLQGIEVMVRRVEQRRDGYGFGPVRAFDEGRLRQSRAVDMESFLQTQGFVRRSAEPRVIIDEVLVPCGLSILTTYAPADFYLIEIFGRGSQIRVYTHAYMRQTGRRPRALIPVNLLPPMIGSC